MSPTILGFDVKVPRERAIRRKVVAIQMPFEGIADQLFENFARSRRRDMEQSEAGCGDAPDPVLLAFVLDASLVAAKLRLLRNCGFEFIVDIGERIGNHARAELRQIAS